VFRCRQARGIQFSVVGDEKHSHLPLSFDVDDTPFLAGDATLGEDVCRRLCHLKHTGQGTIITITTMIINKITLIILVKMFLKKV